jgi:hypothetical protein
LLFILISSDRIDSLFIPPSESVQLYVVPFSLLIGNNSDGSFTRPYPSLQQALDYVEHEYHHGILATGRTTIHLYPTHHFVDTIRFKTEHSYTRLTTMSPADAAISGGVPVTGWTQVSRNTYSAVVPSLTFVNQLFINNQRIVRTRVPTNFSNYLYYTASLNDSTMVRYGFQYQS